MSYLRLEKATSQERELLATPRALAWGKSLDATEFKERNQRLYNHPFGRDHIITYVLKNPENKIVSSLDSLGVKFFHKQKLGDSTSIQEGFLIASVITPPQHRRKGYATLLMSRFLEAQPWNLGVLYSDIDPKFYERWGFKISKRSLYEVSGPFSKNQLTINQLQSEVWIQKVFDLRKSKFNIDPKAQLALAPDFEFWDWQIERFRFFAEKRNKGSLPHVYFEWVSEQGPSYFAVVLNAMTGKAEVLWRDSNHPENLGAIGQIVQGWGCERFSYWDTVGGIGQKIQDENPMCWLKGAAEARAEGFYDPQLCDWW
jgi:GNAT superfamily N-acetyltransferase